jgi:hypothetical protein
MVTLAIAFFITAALYASVGFGGGSTYNALLVLGGEDYRLIPVVALCCNLVVVAGGTLGFARAGLLRVEAALPVVLTSVPMAWLGGATPVDKGTFVLLLGLALVASGILLLLQPSTWSPAPAFASPRRLWLLGLPLGAGIGYLAGIVGIGGGIFLSPILHMARVAHPKVISATASFFILANSAAGLGGQWFKAAGALTPDRLAPYMALYLAVLVGGQLGTRMGIHVLSPLTVRRATAVLVLYVGGRLLYVSG